MKLYSFLTGSMVRAGIEVSGQILDIASAYEVFLGQKGPRPGWPPRMPANLHSILRGGTVASEILRELAAWAVRRPAVPVGTRIHYLAGEVTLFAPIPAPGKILCVDCAAASQAGEANAARMTRVRSKLSSSLAVSTESATVDFQGDCLQAVPRLAVVVGVSLGAGQNQLPPGAIFGFQLLVDCQRQVPTGEEGLALFCENARGYTRVSTALFCLPAETAAARLLWRVEHPGGVVKETCVNLELRPFESVLKQLSEHIDLDAGDLVAIQWGTGDLAAGQGASLFPGSKFWCECSGYAAVSIAARRAEIPH